MRCPEPVRPVIGTPSTPDSTTGADDAHPVRDRILAHLRAAGVPFRHLQHEPTPTSEDSARVRGEPLAIGGKALVVKAGGSFVLVVLSAAHRLDSAALEAHLGVRKSRFASREELAELIGLVPGAVPPFGEPILPLPLIVDASVLANERIAFNAGSLTDSIVMATSDWQQVACVEGGAAVSSGG